MHTALRDELGGTLVSYSSIKHDPAVRRRGGGAVRGGRSSRQGRDGKHGWARPSFGRERGVARSALKEYEGNAARNSSSNRGWDRLRHANWTTREEHAFTCVGNSLGGGSEPSGAGGSISSVGGKQLAEDRVSNYTLVRPMEECMGRKLAAACFVNMPADVTAHAGGAMLAASLVANHAGVLQCHVEGVGSREPNGGGGVGGFAHGRKEFRATGGGGSIM